MWNEEGEFWKLNRDSMWRDLTRFRFGTHQLHLPTFPPTNQKNNNPGVGGKEGEEQGGRKKKKKKQDPWNICLFSIEVKTVLCLLLRDNDILHTYTGVNSRVSK